MDKVVSNIAKNKVINPRKGLGYKQNHLHDNIVAKLASFDYNKNQNSFRGPGIKHIIDLLSLHSKALNPSNLITSLRILTGNKHFDRSIYLEIYTSINSKVLYFTPSQILQLLECIEDSLVFTSSNNSDYAKGDIIDNSLINYTRLVSIHDIQWNILCNIIDCYQSTWNQTIHDSRSMLLFQIHVRCLKLIMELGCLKDHDWKLIHSLSDTILDNLTSCIYSGDDTFIKSHDALKYANTIADTLSLNSIDASVSILSGLNPYKSQCPLMRRVIPTLVNMAIDMKLAYCKGDIQILKFVIDAVLDVHDINITNDYYVNSQLDSTVMLFKKLQNLNQYLSKNCSHEEYISFKFKMINIEKLLLPKFTDSLEFDDTAIDEMVNELSTISNNELDSRNHSLLLSTTLDYCSSLSLRLGNNDGTLERITGSLHYIVRKSYPLLCSDCVLSNVDILNNVKGCYKTFGYLHHTSSRILLNYAMRKLPSSILDGIILLHLYSFCLILPYNLIIIDNERNFQRLLEQIGHKNNIGSYNAYNTSTNCHASTIKTYKDNFSACDKSSNTESYGFKTHLKYIWDKYCHDQ